MNWKMFNERVVPSLIVIAVVAVTGNILRTQLQAKDIQQLETGQMKIKEENAILKKKVNLIAWAVCKNAVKEKFEGVEKKCDEFMTEDQ